MVLYSIQQSEKGISKAYLNLMDRLSEHITLLAKEGKPFTSVIGIKRGLYRMKRQFITPPGTPLPGASPLENKGRNTQINEELELLIGEVLDKFDLDVQDVVEAGLLGEKEIKKALAKYDYQHLVKKGMTGREAKKQLSEKYGFSTSMIEKLIYVRGNKKN
jgi:hypothetical protein